MCWNLESRWRMNLVHWDGWIWMDLDGFGWIRRRRVMVIMIMMQI